MVEVGFERDFAFQMEKKEHFRQKEGQEQRRAE